MPPNTQSMPSSSLLAWACANWNRSTSSVVEGVLRSTRNPKPYYEQGDDALGNIFVSAA